MTKRCSDCVELLRGERKEPHQYLLLMKTSAAGEYFYRCLLCDTCLSHDPLGDTAWSECDVADLHLARDRDLRAGPQQREKSFALR